MSSLVHASKQMKPLTELPGMHNRINGQLYPRQRVIYVDVDETLIINDKVNKVLIKWMIHKSAEGYELNVWSMAGTKHSEQAVERCGIGAIVTHALSKPGIIVDDMRWDWTKYTKAIEP
jgi:hypothetical protein